MLKKLADNLWVKSIPLRVFGLEVGTRMTVIKLKDGGLFLHSPIPLTPELQEDLLSKGEVKAVVAPNCYHHLYIKKYIAAYPQASIYAAPGLPEKRDDLRFHDILGEKPEEAWASDIEQIAARGMPTMNETVFFHPASRTLILTDLSVNFPPAETFWLRFYRRKIQDYDGKLAMPRLIKLMVRDRHALRYSCDRILQWDFDRITVTHGEVFETGGKEAFKKAFEWL